MNLYVYNLLDDYNDKFTIINNVIETNKLYKFELKSPLYISQIKKKEFNNGAYIYRTFSSLIIVLLEDNLEKAKKLFCESISKQIDGLYERIDDLYNQILYIQDCEVNNND